MVKKILLGLVAVIALILVIAAFKSPDYRVERSRTIAAKPEVLFDYFNNHKKFNEWNPWMKMDPTAKNTYTGPESGVGAVASWVGDKTGEGSATITESKPGELVRERMDWKKPMEGSQHRGLHLQTRRRQDHRDLGHVWQERRHPHESHGFVHELRKHVRAGV